MAEHRKEPRKHRKKASRSYAWLRRGGEKMVTIQSSPARSIRIKEKQVG